MKKVWILLLCVVVLTACGPFTAQIEEAIHLTQRVMPTETVAPMSTSTPEY